MQGHTTWSVALAKNGRCMLRREVEGRGRAALTHARAPTLKDERGGMALQGRCELHLAAHTAVYGVRYALGRMGLGYRRGDVGEHRR